MRRFLKRRHVMGCSHCCSAVMLRKCSYVSCLMSLSICVGVLINYYGLVFERIRVDVLLDPADYERVGGNQNATMVASSSAERYTDQVVPNIVHFIWFGEKKKMSFINFISISSAYKVQKPDLIMFHCDHLPVGAWWERLWREVPLSIVHRIPPTAVHDQSLLHMYHKGDIAKIQILLEHGGIYIDYDVIIVQSMDPLRHFDATLGKEKPPKFMAGIIVARKNAPFLRIWYESYKNNYRPFDWDYNCSRMTYQLYLKRPDLLHVEPYKLTTPDWQDRRLLWNDVINWRELYVIHIMQHLSWAEFDPENIKYMNSTFGEVVRYIYYDSPKLIK